MEQSNRKQAIITIAVVAVTIFVVLGTIALAKKKSHKNVATSTDTTSNTNTAQNTTTDSTAQDSAASTPTTSTLKDGSYKATGSYTSPGGNEQITIRVTLKDGVVTETSATADANDPTAEQYQEEFIAGYKDQVVGKKISTLKLSRVAGSSLTSQGFNDAIQQIQRQAQA